jgi:cytidine deaminase
LAWRSTTPCGACRQVLHEFGPDALVVCCTDDAAAERRYSLAELLPEAFGPADLAGRT